jgi:hypothetical protein
MTLPLETLVVRKFLGMSLQQLQLRCTSNTVHYVLNEAHAQDTLLISAEDTLLISSEPKRVLSKTHPEQDQAQDGCRRLRQATSGDIRRLLQATSGDIRRLRQATATSSATDASRRSNVL